MVGLGRIRGTSAVALLGLLLLAAPLASVAQDGGRRTGLLQVRLSKPLSSATAKDGQTFAGVVVKDAAVGTRGTIVNATAGMPVKGTVLYAKPGGVHRAVGILTLVLTSVGGTPVDSSRYHVSGGSLRPTGTAEAVLTPDTVLTFTVSARQSTGSRSR
jgi:hypothetical protein